MKRITAFFPRLVNHIVALVVMLSAGILATTLAGAAPTPWITDFSSDTQLTDSTCETGSQQPAGERR